MNAAPEKKRGGGEEEAYPLGPFKRQIFHPLKADEERGLLERGDGGKHR